MIAVLQRVLRAAVTADGAPSGRCGQGYMILLGVLNGDGEKDALLLAEKIAKLRVFTDPAGKMNLSVTDIGGSALIISNFTLAADYSHGNRPSFLAAAAPGTAQPLYETFTEALRRHIPVETGVFGADMQIDMTADGPVTIMLDSHVLAGGRAV